MLERDENKRKKSEEILIELNVSILEKNLLFLNGLKDYFVEFF